jgi:hypothetical protein
MSHSLSRLACSLAVVCGVRLRHMARILAALFLMPLTKSLIKRWRDDMGAHVPSHEERLRQLWALTPAPACPLDGSYPRGPDHGVMVVRDAPDRILMTHAAASEPGDEARPCLQRFKDCGRQGPAAFSDDSHSVTEALKAVYPQARLQADHFHTGKHSWGHLTPALVSYRRQRKASGAATNDQDGVARAKAVWQWRWSLLKNPSNVSAEEKQAMAELDSADEGLVYCFRSLIRQLVPLFDHSHSDVQAQRSLHQLSTAIRAVDDDHLEQIRTFFDDHWEHALRYLRKKGMGTHRRGSNAESGMRRRRRLEKNHDGMRSAATRQPYRQSYQASKSLSLDIAEFIEQGPQMTGALRV